MISGHQDAAESVREQPKRRDRPEADLDASYAVVECGQVQLKEWGLR